MTTNDSVGLKRGTVHLVDYTPAWESAFAQEKHKLQVALGGAVLGIAHIGSTSVPGLAAKPIIDMVAAVDDLAVYKQLISPLTQLGYEFMPARVFVDRVFFPKGPRSNRTHHLSLVLKDSTGWTDPIIFRDYLRANPLARHTYQTTKQELAQRYPNDRTAYTKAKEHIIADLLKQAKNKTAHGGDRGT